MPELFDLLQKEQHPAVTAALGHYIFVFIHPYMDGNSRIDKFLMNTMLVPYQIFVPTWLANMVGKPLHTYQEIKR